MKKLIIRRLSRLIPRRYRQNPLGLTCSQAAPCRRSVRFHRLPESAAEADPEAMKGRIFLKSISCSELHRAADAVLPAELNYQPLLQQLRHRILAAHPAHTFNIRPRYGLTIRNNAQSLKQRITHGPLLRRRKQLHDPFIVFGICNKLNRVLCHIRNHPSSGFFHFFCHLRNAFPYLRRTDIKTRCSSVMLTGSPETYSNASTMPKKHRFFPHRMFPHFRCSSKF